MIPIEASLAGLISNVAGAIPLLGITDLGINGPSLIAYLINFILLLGILTLFAYKPLLRVLDERSQRIRDSLEAADRAREEAASSQQVIEDQLNEARREGQRLEQAREAAARFQEEQMDQARRDAETFVERARSDIQRERDAAVQEVRANFGDLAITAAERVIRRSLDRQAHEELISQVLEEGEQASAGPRA